MSFLIDTSTLLWFVSGDNRLSNYATAVLEDSGSEIYLSVASLWELAIKINIGRGVALPLPYAEFVEDIVKEERFRLLHINLTHLKRVAELPLMHRDPFDRLLIAQSQVEDLPIITSDIAFDSYPIQRIW